MIEQILTLQFGAFYGGSVGSMLSSWEQAGFFSYVLPFLLIFAIVFGILTKTKIFDNKTINGILALTIGLLALQFDFVPIFFSEIFPRVGVGLSIILALLILAGLFFDPKSKFINYSLLGFGVIIFLVVLFQTFEWTGWSSGYWLYDIMYNWSGIFGLIIFLALIGIVVGSGGKKKKLPKMTGYWAQPTDDNDDST
ncbi:MAG: hypothetical protein ABIH65_02240 [Nanoarchaeota archaeon]